MLGARLLSAFVVWWLRSLPDCAAANSLKVRTYSPRAQKIDLLTDQLTIFASHHKTGSSVVGDILKYCLPTNATKQNMHWQPHPSPHRSQRVVHFMRDLHSLAVSAYLYHKNTGERWSWANGSASEVCRKTGFAKVSAVLPRENESYTDFLSRVPDDVGMAAELFRLRRGVVFNKATSDINKDGALMEIDAALQACQQMASNCTTVCSEDVETRFNDTWEGVVSFMGLRQSAVNWSCLENYTYDKVAKRRPEHITSATVSQKRRESLKRLVEKLDDELLKGRISDLSKRNPCTQG